MRKSEKELDELMARMKLKNEEELERNAVRLIIFVGLRTRARKAGL